MVAGKHSHSLTLSACTVQIHRKDQTIKAARFSWPRTRIRCARGRSIPEGRRIRCGEGSEWVGGVGRGTSRKFWVSPYYLSGGIYGPTSQDLSKPTAPSFSHTRGGGHPAARPECALPYARGMSVRGIQKPWRSCGRTKPPANFSTSRCARSRRAGANASAATSPDPLRGAVSRTLRAVSCCHPPLIPRTDRPRNPRISSAIPLFSHSPITFSACL